MACALFPLLTVALTAEDERLRLDEGSLTEVTLSVEMVLFRLDTCSEVLTVVALSVEMVMLLMLFQSDRSCLEVLTVAPSVGMVLF